MWAVTLLGTDGWCRWQPRLRAIARKEMNFAFAGTKCLCPWSTFELVGQWLAAAPPGLVFLGSSSFHHFTYHLVRRHASCALFVLVCDRHGDCLAAPEGFISCGSWVAEVAALPGVVAIGLVGPQEGEIGALPAKVRLIHPGEELGELERLARECRRAYISIDKDVLLGARTDWGSGELELATILALAQQLRAHCEVVGADVCGEEVPRGPWPTWEELEHIRRNEDINLSLWRALSR
jgi:hypothetical protein